MSDERQVNDTPDEPERLRPGELAQLLLAGGELLPRQRARDQQSDLAGMALKREVLLRLAALDPEPAVMDAALERIILEIGPPFGPTRGVCLSVAYDWEAACTSPQFISWLLQEAIREGEGPRRGKRRAAQPD